MYDAAYSCKVFAAAQTHSATPTNDRLMKTGRLDAWEGESESQLNSAVSSAPARAVAALAQLIHK
jgi:hypothetical protein